ncbi:MAG: DUF6010 family protein [Candidatus Binatia bacterium]
MSFLIAIVVGVVVAVPVLVLAKRMTREGALDLMAVQLGAIAAVYVGSSLALGGIPLVATEMIGVTGFVVLALMGRWGSVSLLVIGYAAHAVWDLLHYWGVFLTFLPEWYAPFCLGYDGIVAAFVAAVLMRRDG